MESINNQQATGLQIPYKIEKMGYIFEVKASCASEALYKLMQERPDHEVFRNCTDGYPTGFSVTGPVMETLTVSSFEGLKFGDIVQIDWFGRPMTRYVGFSCGEHICWDGIKNCIITVQTKESPSMT